MSIVFVSISIDAKSVLQKCHRKNEIESFEIRAKMNSIWFTERDSFIYTAAILLQFFILFLI